MISKTMAARLDPATHAEATRLKHELSLALGRDLSLTDILGAAIALVGSIPDALKAELESRS